MTSRRQCVGIRKSNELTIRYAMRHPDKRPKGRKLKPIRKWLYDKMDRKWEKMRTALNEFIIDIARLRRPKGMDHCAYCPMLRWK